MNTITTIVHTLYKHQQTTVEQISEIIQNYQCGFITTSEYLYQLMDVLIHHNEKLAKMHMHINSDITEQDVKDAKAIITYLEANGIEPITPKDTQS